MHFFWRFSWLRTDETFSCTLSADEKFDGTYHANIIVHYDGSCLWIPPGMFKSTCSIDISWFPFDDQMCNMKFGSWTHDGRYLDLQMEDENGADVSNFIRNGEWDLIGKDMSILICKLTLVSMFPCIRVFIRRTLRCTRFAGKMFP